MDITFKGKYKSITSFTWANVPNFVILTGKNGTGKSQLLDLIYQSLFYETNNKEEGLLIRGKLIQPNEVIFLKGEWQLDNTSHVDLASIQQQAEIHYNNFRNGNFRRDYLNFQNNVQLYMVYSKILKITGKQYDSVTRAEFFKLFPEILIERESQLSQKIGEIFYQYRISEIDLLASGKNKEDIKKVLGEKPWIVLREIIKEAKLPFDINDPSSNGIRDHFILKLTHQILKEEINFNDLSSGEKVLIALVFYLYNSQEKKVFPKLLLLDEPDAHLHPSMSQQFLNVIKNVLVDKFDVQVIMTTHSPSTITLAPNESIYEMSIDEPRIKKSPSKNHSVSLLTAGLVYVGDGTKYFLVEDNDDASFYSFVYSQLTTENQIEANIPLVFIPVSTKDKSGGKNAVKDWVNKLQSSGLTNIVQGLIDADSGNFISEGVYKIDRYSIENYLADPLLVYAALIDREMNPLVEGIKLSVGEEYKLKSLPNETLQKIADTVLSKVEGDLKNYFNDFDVKELDRIEISFVGGIKLLYPKWLLYRRGKSILNELYNKVYTSPIINFNTLFKALRKLNLFPKDLVDKFLDLKAGINSNLP